MKWCFALPKSKVPSDLIQYLTGQYGSNWMSYILLAPVSAPISIAILIAIDLFAVNNSVPFWYILRSLEYGIQNIS